MKRELRIIVPLICVIIVGITFYMIFDIESRVEEKYYETDEIEVNEVEDDIISDTEDTFEESTSVENNEEEVSNELSSNTNSIKEEVSEDEDNYSKAKFDEAKSLVQKAWGEDNTVYFTNEGFNSEGLYMVAARDKTSTAVKNYFKVNLDTKKVQIDY